MSDADALLRAIIAHPDDDTPRLVYADWLDEHDQPERAELIRLQIERVPRPRNRAAPRCADREAELFARNRKAWDRPFREAVPGGAFGYRRGFVALVGMEERFYHQSFARLLRMTPLEEVRVPFRSFGLQQLPRPGLSHPSHVRFRVALTSQLQSNEAFVFDVLRPNPAALEPYLRSGSWVVNAVDESSVYCILPSNNVCDAFRRQRRYNLALRPYRAAKEEFAGWWREMPTARLDQLLSGQVSASGSHWYVFENGEEVGHHASEHSGPGESIMNRLARAGG